MPTTTRHKLFAAAVATGLLVPSVAISSDPDIACEEAYPEDCLTIWQAHALGYVEITSSAYSGVQVTIDNTGEFALCLE
ncbi:hypothetical protein H8E07_05085, partial [bacterium]|nr:hypothetical protein [bacterium]